ncbi:hypothetical protein [Burkholderia cepacia]|uniref:hypothetical protein n=1 Tax=Burkholderia cepacia TaxID=292 RepID=UPI0012D8D1FA|nr:hypothetical protein [Burkholderia cepacia]
MSKDIIAVRLFMRRRPSLRPDQPGLELAGGTRYCMVRRRLAADPDLVADPEKGLSERGLQ